MQKQRLKDVVKGYSAWLQGVTQRVMVWGAAALITTTLVGCTQCVEMFQDLPSDATPVRYLGLKSVPPETLVSLLPQNATKPVVLEFTSQFCSDCKRQAPLMTALEKRYAHIPVMSLEIQKDRLRHGAIFQAFQPTTVPTVLFIRPGGEVVTILYGLQEKATLKEAFTRLKAN